MEPFFSPNSSGDLRSDAHQSQIIGGDADEDHTQIMGGIQSNYWGGYGPPSRPGFGTPGYKKNGCSVFSSASLFPRNLVIYSTGLCWSFSSRQPAIKSRWGDA